MRQVVEYASKALAKSGEELCGDTVHILSTPTSFIAVLSDGLGSGVKANILSTLTAQIAATMFKQGAHVEEVLETLASTLPECQVRKLAYATFAMVKVVRGREAYLVEYDSPPLIVIRDGKQLKLEAHERTINERRVREAVFEIKVGDYMVMTSDGYEHAGVGKLYRLGWGQQNIAVSVERWARTNCDAYELMHALSSTCLKLYDGKPGDDATAVAMRVRPAVAATILTGPPANKADDERVVAKLMESKGLKAICGGTTAQMAARVLGRELQVEWVRPSQRHGEAPRKQNTPPVARLEGVDLVTEGILTLGKTAELLERAESTRDLPHDDDAATQLARMLLSSDEIHLIVGMALNPNQVADVIRGEPMRHMYIRQIVRELQRRQKRVSEEYI
ncbi:MAG: SpoIIE family protein phosphatase [Chloroflexi bacterium]|nr:SpoIIE family protein phosphatase [Chloroflexota bacterium]